MKKILFLFIGIAAIVSCNNESARYTDLQTGKTIKLEKDSKSGLMVNADTKKPVYIYVDHQTDDTIYGRTGISINGKLIKTANGEYKYLDDVKVDDVNGEIKVKDGDYKMKVDKDGDIKIKTDDKTIKIDGETGEKKVKKN